MGHSTYNGWLGSVTQDLKPWFDVDLLTIVNLNFGFTYE